MSSWRCCLCPAKGTADNRELALQAFNDHYDATHYRRKNP